MSAAREPGGRPGASRTAVVLCGGRSSRLGRDKALALLGGRTLLDRAVETARAVAGEVLLAVGPEPRFGDLGLPVVTDAVPGRGPLGGIAAGLEKASGTDFLVLAVDLPFVTAGTIEILFEQLPGADLVMPRTPRGLEPLCCVGLTFPCLAAARRLLEEADPAARDLVRRVAAGREYAPGDAAGWAALFENVNTPEDLERAGRRWPAAPES